MLARSCGEEVPRGTDRFLPGFNHEERKLLLLPLPTSASRALRFQIAACWDGSWADWGHATSFLSSARAEAQVMMLSLLHRTQGKPPQSHKREQGVTSRSQGKQGSCCLA